MHWRTGGSAVRPVAGSWILILQWARSWILPLQRARSWILDVSDSGSGALVVGGRAGGGGGSAALGALPRARACVQAERPSSSVRFQAERHALESRVRQMRARSGDLASSKSGQVRAEGDVMVGGGGERTSHGAAGRGRWGRRRRRRSTPSWRAATCPAVGRVAADRARGATGHPPGCARCGGGVKRCAGAVGVKRCAGAVGRAGVDARTK